MNEHRNPCLRLLLAVLGAAVALHVAWVLIEPVLPAIGVVVSAFAMWQLIHWYLDRW
jgi:hypothetical protein